MADNKHPKLPKYLVQGPTETIPEELPVVETVPEEPLAQETHDMDMDSDTENDEDEPLSSSMANDIMNHFASSEASNYQEFE